MEVNRTENLKCFFISTEFPPGPGGIGMHSYNIINELKEIYNWDFLILSNQENSNNELIKSFNSSYHSPIITLEPTPTKLKLFKKLKFIFHLYREYSPDIIIASGKHAVWFGGLLRFFFGKKLITFSHGSEFGTKDKRERLFNRLSFGQSDLNFSVSNYTDNFIKENTSIDLKRSVVLHNGADPTSFRKLSVEQIEEFKKRKHLNEKKIIVTLGNVSKRKGQWVVIKSLPLILKENPDLHYYCIGLKTDAEKLSILARELGVHENVHFLGKLPQEELIYWLNAADVFAMTSVHTEDGKFEGFGISVIEAALCGTPGIVSKGNSGVSESVIDGVTGLHAIEGDIIDFSSKINRLFFEKFLLNNLSNNALKNSNENMTWSNVVKKLVSQI